MCAGNRDHGRRLSKSSQLTLRIRYVCLRHLSSSLYMSRTGPTLPELRVLRYIGVM